MPKNYVDHEADPAPLPPRKRFKFERFAAGTNAARGVQGFFGVMALMGDPLGAVAYGIAGGIIQTMDVYNEAAGWANFGSGVLDYAVPLKNKTFKRRGIVGMGKGPPYMVGDTHPFLPLNKYKII